MRSRVLIIVAVAAALAVPALPAPQKARPAALADRQADTRVDINTASMDELMKLPGLTRTWAARIVRFRPYRAKNELAQKGIVPDVVYLRIRDLIVAHRLGE